MYIAHKSNVLLTTHKQEWQCRRKAKGLDKSEYWIWLATITDADGVVTYPSETFTIAEVTDEDVQIRLNQLGDYVNSNRAPDEALVYNITWSDSKVSAVTGQDMDEEDITIQTHFSGDDAAKNKRVLAENWTTIRQQRDRLLTESDWVIIKAKEEHINTSIDDNWITYRTALRDITKQSDPTNITWPTKP